MMSWTRCSCSATDIETFLIATSSATMSRISSPADLQVQLGQLRQIDGVDQGVEDRGLGRVVVVALLADDLGGGGAALRGAQLLERGGELRPAGRRASLRAVGAGQAVGSGARSGLRR